jgi:hypothetical protein
MLAPSFAVSLDYYDDKIEAALLQKENLQHDAEAEADREQHLDQAALRGGM